jgi:hypothetical protein
MVFSTDGSYGIAGLYRPAGGHPSNLIYGESGFQEMFSDPLYIDASETLSGLHMLMGVRDADGMALYLDDVQIGSDAGAAQNAAGFVQFGAGPSTVLGEVAFFDRALTEPERGQWWSYVQGRYGL